MRNRLMLVAALLPAISPAAAHVTLAEATAPAGSMRVERFRIGHGCSGSPTTGLRITLPPGVTDARPQPKPGWTVGIEHAGDRVIAIAWKGGALADDQFDEFAILMKMPAVPGMLLFAANQTCESGVKNWVAAPQDHAKNPAPALTVTAPDADTMPGMDMGGMHHGM